MSKHVKSNTPPRPKFPQRTALSTRQTVRSILRLGRSHGITLPAKFIRRIYDPARPFVLCTVNDDGTCTIAPLADLAETPTDQPAADPQHHVDRPEKRSA